MRTNKPQVATLPNGSDIKKNKIRQVLRENPQGLTPKYVSLYSEVKYNTVKSLLPKMLEVQQKEGLPGHYILVERTNQGMFDCKIQNLRLSFSSDRIDVERRISEVNSLNDLIKFRFEIGLKSKKATMTVGTDYPLDFSCLGLVGYLFQMLIEKYCNFCPGMEEISLDTFEINKDYFKIALEGCSSIRLDTLSTEYKLYYKEKRYAREEYKLKQPINLTFVRDLVNKGLFSAETNQRIEELSSEMKAFKKEMTRLTRIIPHFLKDI